MQIEKFINRSTLTKISLAIAAALITWGYLSFIPYAERLVAAIFLATIVLWMTEAIPLALSAILAPLILAVFGALDWRVFLACFYDPTILLFVGSFILAKGLSVSQLDKRIAFSILSKSAITKNPWRLLATIGVLACGLSLFMSNTGVTAMLLPVGITMISLLDPQHKNPFTIGLLLMLTWGSSVAVGVMVGTPPNLIAVAEIRKTLQLQIGFVDWMMFGMPITGALLALAWIVLLLMYGRTPIKTESASKAALAELASLGKMKVDQYATAIIFAITLLLWSLPDTIAALLGTSHQISKIINAYLSPTNAALFGAALLVLLPLGRNKRPVLSTWQAININWGTILLFAGGIALGRAVFNSGLATRIGEVLHLLAQGESLFVITALATISAVIISEFASNTAAATIVVPLSIAVAQAAGVNPLPPVLAAALGSSLGFMMPISTPPNSIIYSSKLVPAKEMMRAGIILDIGGVIIVIAGLRLILPMMGMW